MCKAHAHNPIIPSGRTGSLATGAGARCAHSQSANGCAQNWQQPRLLERACRTNGFGTGAARACAPCRSAQTCCCGGGSAPSWPRPPPGWAALLHRLQACPLHGRFSARTALRTTSMRRPCASLQPASNGTVHTQSHTSPQLRGLRRTGGARSGGALGGQRGLRIAPHLLPGKVAGVVLARRRRAPAHPPGHGRRGPQAVPRRRRRRLRRTWACRPSPGLRGARPIRTPTRTRIRRRRLGRGLARRPGRGLREAGPARRARCRAKRRPASRGRPHRSRLWSFRAARAVRPRGRLVGRPAGRRGRTGHRARRAGGHRA